MNTQGTRSPVAAMMKASSKPTSSGPGRIAPFQSIGPDPEPEMPLADDPRRVARPLQHRGQGQRPGSMISAASPGRTPVPFRRHAYSPVSRA